MLKQKIFYKKCYKTNLTYKFNKVARVIKFKNNNNNTLTDDDIKNLFLGVFNLLKTNAYKKAEIAFKREIVYYQELLNLNLSKVVKLQKEIKRLKGRSFNV